jgi:hypothetical protein
MTQGHTIGSYGYLRFTLLSKRDTRPSAVALPPTAPSSRAVTNDLRWRHHPSCISTALWASGLSHGAVAGVLSVVRVGREPVARLVLDDLDELVVRRRVELVEIAIAVLRERAYQRLVLHLVVGAEDLSKLGLGAGGGDAPFATVAAALAASVVATATLVSAALAAAAAALVPATTTVTPSSSVASTVTSSSVSSIATMVAVSVASIIIAVAATVAVAAIAVATIITVTAATTIVVAHLFFAEHNFSTRLLRRSSTCFVGRLWAE